MDNDEMPPYDGKDIYLKNFATGEIVGLHAMGEKIDHEVHVHHLDGSITVEQRDFRAIEQWGNNYDTEYNMLGRGSFRIFGDIEEVAKELETDGWVRFERDKV